MTEGPRRHRRAPSGPSKGERARVEVRDLGGEIVIETDAAGLRTLAGRLLTLAQDGTSDGTHLHLEEGDGLDEGSEPGPGEVRRRMMRSAPSLPCPMQASAKVGEE